MFSSYNKTAIYLLAGKYVVYMDRKIHVLTSDIACVNIFLAILKHISQLIS